MDIKWKTIIITAILGISMLLIFSVKSFADNKPDITKEEIINWLEEQGEHDKYLYHRLSYELINLDNDSDLEIAIKIPGGVHLGHFIIFDKKEHDKYHLIIEKNWHVASWNFSNHMADPVEVGNKTIFEIVDRTGGTGTDVYYVYLCYIDNGKFFEAWKGTLNTVSVFEGNYYLEIGNYRFNKSNNLLYSWLSKYNYELDGVTLKKKYGTNAMIYKFDGTKFILESETGYIK